MVAVIKSIGFMLTRLTERTVVQRYIYPAMLSPPPTLQFADQFAFRPTRSVGAYLFVTWL